MTDQLNDAPPEVTAAAKRLSKRMRDFALALPTASSQEAAALAAGFAASTARSDAAKFAANPDVRLIVDHIIGRAIKTTEITFERCMQELAKVAFGDPQALFGPNGELLPPDRWPKNASAIVSEVQQIDQYDQDGAKVGTVNKIKFADKHAALRTAFQLIDAFPDKKKQVTHTHRVGVVMVPEKRKAIEADVIDVPTTASALEAPKSGGAPAFMVRKIRAERAKIE